MRIALLILSVFLGPWLACSAPIYSVMVDTNGVLINTNISQTNWQYRIGVFPLTIVVTSTPPIVSTVTVVSNTVTISNMIPAATALVPGYLDTNDFTNFEAKVSAEVDPVFAGSAAGAMTSDDLDHFITAYSWGDHSVAGYLTAEGDPIFTNSVAYGIDSQNYLDWQWAYLHSQITSNSNPHGTQITNIAGLQGALNTKAETNWTRFDGRVSVTQYGAVAGNSNFDNSIAFLAAMGSGKEVFVPPGTWWATNIVLTNAAALVGAGDMSIIAARTNAAPILLDAQGYPFRISKLKLLGQADVSWKTNASYGTNSGLRVNPYLPTAVAGVTVQGFSMYGVEIDGTGGSNSHSSQLSIANSRFVNNYCGVGGISNVSEYVRYTGLDVSFNCIGLLVLSGNANIAGCNLNENNYGVIISGVNVANDGHGSLVGGTINHNTHALYLTTLKYGFNIGNVCVFGGDIEFKDSQGIVWTGGQIGVDDLYFGGGGRNYIRHCWIYEGYDNTEHHNWVSADDTLMAYNYNSTGDLRYDLSPEWFRTVGVGTNAAGGPISPLNSFAHFADPTAPIITLDGLGTGTPIWFFRNPVTNAVIQSGGDIQFKLLNGGNWDNGPTIRTNGSLGIGVSLPTNAIDSANSIGLRAGGVWFPDGTYQTTSGTNAITGSGTAGRIPIYSGALSQSNSIFTSDGTRTLTITPTASTLTPKLFLNGLTTNSSIAYTGDYLQFAGGFNMGIYQGYIFQGLWGDTAMFLGDHAAADGTIGQTISVVVSVPSGGAIKMNFKNGLLCTTNAP